MADQTSTTNKVRPASEGKPPKALMKVMNPIMKAVLLSPLHGRMGGMILLLTFTGRKTGKQYTTPVSYHRQGDTLVLFTDSPWWKNMRGGAPVSVLVNGKQLQGFAEAIEDKEEILAATKDFLRENGVRSARRIGISLDASHEPTEDELRTALADRVIIRIKVPE